MWGHSVGIVAMTSRPFYLQGMRKRGEKEGVKEGCTGHLSLTVTNNLYNKFMKRKGLL